MSVAPKSMRLFHTRERLLVATSWCRSIGGWFDDRSCMETSDKGLCRTVHQIGNGELSRCSASAFRFGLPPASDNGHPENVTVDYKEIAGVLRHFIRFGRGFFGTGVSGLDGAAHKDTCY